MRTAKQDFISLMVRLFLRRAAAAALALIPMYVFFDTNVGNLLFRSAVTSVLVLAYLFFSVYRAGESLGIKDKNYIQYGHRTAQPHKALIAGLIAESPFLLGCLLALCASWGVLPDAFQIMVMGNLPFGVFYQLFPSVWVYVACTVFVPLTAHLGYTNGIKGVDIFTKILVKPSRK